MGTICDDSFGIDEGHVICRQLGYDGATDYLHTSVFGEGYGPILGFLDCTGDENYFMDCIYQDWGTTACSHREDVGLICSDDDGSWWPLAVIGIVIVIVIVIIGIISCSICCFCACTRSGTRQRSGDVAMGTHQMNRVPAAIPSGVTRQNIGDPNPPASSLVMSSPRMMYAPLGAQINPAYSQQNYPQKPYATQPAVVSYPLQPALTTSANAPYPTQSSSAPSYPPQPAIAPHQPHHPTPQHDVYPHQPTDKDLYP
ncbi:hypothetical protein BSL78_21046 [Apostichopus japonicus]|uniref:SRCR domain-containing protein n=1 Tax=Stichopus japonicus TaxID=307972 RepID=A0A2G8K273_STIJA|nr:hypothetical protein BSL78_21046 [Apostichopus japonicus]